jgi:Tfp pilus assembly protein PilO
MKSLIIAAIFLVGAIGMFFGASTKILDNITAKNQEKATLEDVLGQFNDIRKAKNDLIDAYNAVSETDMAKISGVVPLTTREGDLLVAFDNMTKDNGLLLKRIDIKPSAAKDTGLLMAEEAPFDKVAISLVLDGSYESFSSFMKNGIEKSLRIIDMKSLSFHAGDQSTSYEFNVEAAAYMQKQPK